MKLISMAGVAVGTMMMAAAVSAAAGVARPYDRQDRKDKDEKVTVVGCAVKGDGHDDGFLLVNNVERTTIAALSPTAPGVEVNQVTTAELKPARVLYWLDDDDHAVRPLMGQTVEIVGELKGDIKRGEIKAEREKGMIELEINAAGHKGKVTLPDVPSAIGS